MVLKYKLNMKQMFYYCNSQKQALVQVPDLIFLEQINTQ